MKAYYIYHIPGVKIGCSKNPKQRVKTQGYSTFQILETHTDIDIAADREIQLQKQYGYRVDKGNELYSNKFSNMGKSANAKGNKTMIENKIGIFGASNEQRKLWAKNASNIGVAISADKRRGQKLNQETIDKMKLNNHVHVLKNITKKCEHCSMVMNLGNYARWHGDNCKGKK
jgi:hypothetical protein